MEKKWPRGKEGHLWVEEPICLESSVREETACFLPSYVNVYPTSTSQVWRAGQITSGMPAGWQASPQTNALPAHLDNRKVLPCSKMELWVCALRDRQYSFEGFVSTSAFFFITLQSLCWPMLLARFRQQGILGKNTKNFSILAPVSHICNISSCVHWMYHWVPLNTFLRDKWQIYLSLLF